MLWVDAHPDVLTPNDSPHGHTHVLTALLGRGDPDLVGEVDTLVKPSRVMCAGLDPKTFGPVLFNNPDARADFLAGVPRGRLAPDHVVRLLQDIATACDVVGLAITEYLPWEAIATRNLLRQLPLLAG